MKLVIHNGARVWGGNEKWLTNLAIGLAETGHEVVVSCRSGSLVESRLGEAGIPTTRLRPRGPLDLPRWYQFARWLEDYGPDALLSTSWNRIPELVRAARRARVGRFVVRLGIVRALPAGRYTRAFRRGADAMIVNSREIRAEWLRSAPWFPESAVRVIHNGIRPPAPAPPGFREDFRRKLGLPPEAGLIAGVGNIHPRKGFDVLIAALARLSDRDAHAVIVGDGPERPALERQARDLGVAGRVHWVGFRQDVTDVLSACDAFVLSSRNEGMANVMLEAMAVDAPVVATAVSGVGEALGADDGRPPAGWIVPVDDPPAMAAALDEVLASDGAEGEARRRSAEARERIRRDYGIERMIAESEDVLFGRGH
jgi:glycosyltransferase involved in cell wall biosynthesis